MPSQKLSDLMNELDSLIIRIEPEIEGLNDFARLNLLPATKAKVVEVTKDFTRRSELMKLAVKALNNLADDGYPDSPARTVTGEVFQDLRSNVVTLTAAFSKFAPAEEAVTAAIVPGAREVKPG